tara:strand:- start:287 stop:751 length:465 start_codon:yes stop_codon:yes gene_type:complete
MNVAEFRRLADEFVSEAGIKYDPRKVVGHRDETIYTTDIGSGLIVVDDGRVEYIADLFEYDSTDRHDLIPLIGEGGILESVEKGVKGFLMGLDTYVKKSGLVMEAGIEDKPSIRLIVETDEDTNVLGDSTTRSDYAPKFGEVHRRVSEYLTQGG